MRIELDPEDLEPIIEQAVARAMRSRQPAGLESTDGRLALRRREAAAAIGVSVSTLDGLTRQGKIPHLRPGGDNGAPVYPVDLLRTWLRERAENR
jgi:hypothetical protein